MVKLEWLKCSEEAGKTWTNKPETETQIKYWVSISCRPHPQKNLSHPCFPPHGTPHAPRCYQHHIYLILIYPLTVTPLMWNIQNRLSHAHDCAKQLKRGPGASYIGFILDIKSHWISCFKQRFWCFCVLSFPCLRSSIWTRLLKFWMFKSDGFTT